MLQHLICFIHNNIDWFYRGIIDIRIVTNLKLGLAVGLNEVLLLMLLLNVAAGLKRPSLDCNHISSSTLIWLSTIPGVDLHRLPTNPLQVNQTIVPPK